MSIEIFEPLGHETASEHLGFVLLNQVGSAVSQDTGRDAQTLANQFGLAVIAVDRPGTASLIRSGALAADLSVGSGYAAEMSAIGRRIDKQVDNLGLERVIVAGRSAAGLGALALTFTETITNQEAVFAAEPVGCEPMTVKSGAKRFKDYLQFQKELQKKHGDSLILPVVDRLPLLVAAERITTMLPLFFIDKFHNQGIWATDASLVFAAHIAEHQTDIDTTVEFAEHSLTITDEIFQMFLGKVEGLRQDGAPFMLNRTKNTTHASYDNRSYMAERLKPLVERTLQNLRTDQHSR